MRFLKVLARGISKDHAKGSFGQLARFPWRFLSVAEGKKRESQSPQGRDVKPTKRYCDGTPWHPRELQSQWESPCLCHTGRSSQSLVGYLLPIPLCSSAEKRMLRAHQANQSSPVFQSLENKIHFWGTARSHESLMSRRSCFCLSPLPGP